MKFLETLKTIMLGTTSKSQETSKTVTTGTKKLSFLESLTKWFQDEIAPYLVPSSMPETRHGQVGYVLPELLPNGKTVTESYEDFKKSNNLKCHTGDDKVIKDFLTYFNDSTMVLKSSFCDVPIKINYKIPLRSPPIVVNAKDRTYQINAKKVPLDVTKRDKTNVFYDEDTLRVVAIEQHFRNLNDNAIIDIRVWHGNKSQIETAVDNLIRNTNKSKFYNLVELRDDGYYIKQKDDA